MVICVCMNVCMYVCMYVGRNVSTYVCVATTVIGSPQLTKRC